jgi:hypothetical protein
MTGLRRLLLIALLPVAAGAQPRTWLGPHVNLEATGVTAAEAFDALGRQLNTHFWIGWSNPQTAPTYDVHLHDLTPAEAVARLAELTGQKLRRNGREGWGPADAPSELPALGKPLPPPLGAWTVWLREIACHFTGTVSAPGRGGRQAHLAITPSFLVQAPSDAELLRVTRCRAAAAVTADGAELSTNDRGWMWNQSYNDPSCWLLAPELGPLDRPVSALASVGFDLLLVDLSERVFEFEPLAAAGRHGGELQTDGEVDARLDPPAPGAPPSFVLSGPIPAGAGDHWLERLQRPGTVDARLYAAGGRPLYSHLETRNVSHDPTHWEAHLAVTVDGPDARLTPARLTLTVYLPGVSETTLHVGFNDVPAPPLPLPLGR